MKKNPDIFAYPTESFYALGAKASSKAAIQQLFHLKKRTENKPIALIAGNVLQVKKFFFMNLAEYRLARKYWPGSLTLLLRPKKTIAARVLGARRIGVRVPAHALAREIALGAGAPITATSANISGRPPTKSVARVKRDFPDILVIPGQCGQQKKPSTVVEVVGRAVKIIRPGSVRLS